jgi:hypothetical protein
MDHHFRTSNIGPMQHSSRPAAKGRLIRDHSRHHPVDRPFAVREDLSIGRPHLIVGRDTAKWKDEAHFPVSPHIIPNCGRPL